MTCKYSLPFIFCRVGMFGRFHQWYYLGLEFYFVSFFFECFNCKCNFVSRYKTVQVTSFFLSKSFGSLFLSRNPCHWSYQIYWHRTVCGIFFYRFSVYSIRSDIPPHVPIFIICVFSLSFQSACLEFITFVDFFLKSNFWLH